MAPIELLNDDESSNIEATHAFVEGIRKVWAKAKYILELSMSKQARLCKKWLFGSGHLSSCICHGCIPTWH